jgi:hypothetical protein
MAQISKNLMCICMRNGAQLWVEQERIAKLQRQLQQSTGHVFVALPSAGDTEEVINSADIVGIFSAQTMAELNNRKNGKWQYSFSQWHPRGNDCNCADQKLKAMYEQRRNLIKACQICLGAGHKGIIEVGGKQMYDRCECNVEITKQISQWEEKYELYHVFYKDEFG